MCVTDVDDVDDDICAKALQQEQMTQKLERQKQLNIFKQQQLIKEEQQLRIVQAQSLQAVSQQELGHAAPETEEGAENLQHYINKSCGRYKCSITLVSAD